MKNTLHFTFLRALVILAFGLFFNLAAGQTTVNHAFTSLTGNIDSNISYTTAKNSASNDPFISGSQLRLYFHNSGNGCSVTLVPANGAIINQVRVTAASGNAPLMKYNVDSGADVSVTATSNIYTLNNLNSSTSLRLRNASTTSAQMRIDNIEITYSVPVSSAPVVSPGTVNGTFGQALNYQIISTGNPTSYSVVSGALPNGLSLGANGIISGTPELSGNYSASITATNSVGTSAAATIDFVIAKANQSVVLNNLNVNTLTAPVSLPATTTNGQTLTYVSSDLNIASISGNTISFLQEGSAVISASATGNQNLNDFSNSFNVVIAKASQTVALNDISVNLGAGAITLPSTSNEGLAISYVSNNSSVASISGNTLAFGTAGTAVITATQSGNMTYAPFSDTFDVVVVDPSVIPCFEENFAGVSGNNTTTGGSSNLWLGNANFPNAGNSVAYQAGDAIRLGSGSNSGTLTSKPLDNLSGNLIVRLDVKGWSSVEGSINVTLGGATQNYVYTARLSDAFVNAELTFQNVAANSVLIIQTSNGRAFVDNIAVCLAPEPSTSTTWTGTWSNGTPTTALDAVIAGNYNTSTNGAITAKSLTVNSGVFTIASGTSVTVENAVINSAGVANFIVENNGNLIQNTTATNSGAITVQRNSNPLFRYDYTLWASPVVGQNVKAFSPATLSNRFLVYNTATGTNGDYEALFPAQSESAYNFEAGKGYLIRTSDTHPLYVSGNTGTVINAEFKGVPFNQNINFPLSSAATGFNLVGNPYASPISIAQLFADNSAAIDGTVWFWRKRNGVADTGYATSTGVGVTSTHPEAAAINTNGVIGAGQGFFVKVKSGATQNTLNLSNALRSTNTGGSFFRSYASDAEKHRIWLSISTQDEIVGQTLLGYMEGATQGIDYGIEGKYFNDSPVAFSSFVENQEFAIQGRSLPFEATDVVPMSFKTDVAGNFTISVANFDGLFAQGQTIFIKDKFTGQVHDIKTSSYTFATEAGVFINRFDVVYQSLLSVGTPNVDSNAIVVYKQNGSLVVNAGQYEINTIEVYDMSGRLVFKKNNVNATDFSTGSLSVANQVLVVKVTTQENGTVNKKVVY